MAGDPRKKVLLFSTLNPYPFWAGSENFWFDFVLDKRVNPAFTFNCALADSPVTQKKASQLTATGVQVHFYDHFNVSFAKRNFYRIRDIITRNDSRTFPWYGQIQKDKYDLVLFNVAALADLPDLAYPVKLCQKKRVPYWLILQHGYEDFFPASQEELETIIRVTTSARRFIFISRRNREVLERAIGQKLTNAVDSVNALPGKRITEAIEQGNTYPVNEDATARFFNLGRFSPRDKAQHLLLEAFTADLWKNRNWQLSFIGVAGFGKDYLEKLVAYYGLDSDKVRIKAPTDNVFDEIVKQDVLLMPSLSEGTPFAMVESMACGRPALGTPVGGIPELIIDKHTGWLSHSTSITDLADKLEEVWQSRQHWAQVGHQAQEHVRKNYNQESSFEPLVRLLQEDATV